MSKQNLLKILLNSLIGVALIIIWLQFVDISEISKSLSQTKIYFLVPFILLFILATVLRSLRLKILLKFWDLSLWQLTNLTFLSQFLSFLIPIRAGEIAKGVYLLGSMKNYKGNLSKEFSQAEESQHINLAHVIVWILIDRFFDFWTILALLIILFPFVHINLPAQFLTLVILIFAIFTLSTVIILSNQNFALYLLKIVKKALLIKKLQDIFYNFCLNILNGFYILKLNLKSIPLLIFISVLALFTDALMWFVVFTSLSILPNIVNLFYSSMISMITFLVPAAPGYIGSAQASGLLVFGTILGLAPNLASAGVVLFSILMLIILPIFGLIGLYFTKFNLKEVWLRLKSKD